MQSKLKSYRYIIIAVILIAAILRSYGLDSHLQADESIEIDRALNLTKGVFDGSRITKGGIYLLLTPVYLIASLFSDNYTTYVVLGRLVQVLIGCAIVFIIYQILSNLYPKLWAVLFSLPVIINLQMIYNSHHVNVQNLMFLAVVIHLFYILKTWPTPPRNLGLSLIPLAIAMASQISAAIVIVPFCILGFFLYVKSDKELKRQYSLSVFKFGLIALLIYFLMTPGILISFKTTFRYITDLLGITEGIISQAETSSSYAIVNTFNLWIRYARYAMHFYGKLNMALLVISIMVIMIRRKWLLFYPLGVLVVLYVLLANASQTTYAGRYLIPGLLMGFIIMPFCIVELSKWIKRLSDRPRNVLATLVVVILVFNFSRLALVSAQYVKQFGLEDTRDILSVWVDENIAESVTILSEDNVNYPIIKNHHTEFISHWNAYPPLDSVDIDLIILNISHINYLTARGVETTYQRFNNALRDSPEWNLIYSIKPKSNETTGPEFHVFASNTEGK